MAISFMKSKELTNVTRSSPVGGGMRLGYKGCIEVCEPWFGNEATKGVWFGNEVTKGVWFGNEATKGVWFGNEATDDFTARRWVDS